jgi:hypothetical protein
VSADSSTANRSAATTRASGRCPVSLANDDQIAWHELGGRDRALAAATDDGRRQLDRAAQRQQRPLGPGFLEEAEDSVEHDNRRDDARLEPLPDHRRDCRRCQKQARERIRELPDRNPDVARPLGAAKQVRAESFEPVNRVGL